jgi:phosphatidate cytidylyltransferase
MLKTRLITALWGIPLLVATIWFGGQWLFTSFVAVWAVLAVLEFYRLLKPLKINPLHLFGTLWTLLFIVSRNTDVAALTEPYLNHTLLLPTLVTGALVISLLLLLARRERFNAFPSWVWTVAGIFYVGWLLGYVLALRGVQADGAPDVGRNWVFYALFCTFGSDTAAYFVGRAIGRRKLAPSISPGKTWEGTVAGLFGAVAVSLAFLLNTPVSLASQLTPLQAVVLGLLVSIAGQLGDLVESLFKRNVGAKDSGSLLPGHGGVLDRMDSVVFAVVVVYYWVWIIIR